jgi:hypothetical protein
MPTLFKYLPPWGVVSLNIIGNTGGLRWAFLDLVLGLSGVETPSSYLHGVIDDRTAVENPEEASEREGERVMWSLPCL